MSAPAREFELAVRTFSGELYRLAYWLARDKYVAEELVQDCFQRAWNNWESLNDPTALKKWLFTILRREFLRRFERKQFDIVDIDSIDEFDMPMNEGPDMVEILSLRKALASAPASLRDVLVMQVLGGFSSDELARLEQTTSGAITTRLSRARLWLRAYLTDSEVPLSKPVAPRGKIQ